MKDREHRIDTGSPEELKLAADNADWHQVAANCMYGPPCFHYEPARGRFCLRAKAWHDKHAERMFHNYVPLSALIGRTK